MRDIFDSFLLLLLIAKLNFECKLLSNFLYYTIEVDAIFNGEELTVHTVPEIFPVWFPVLKDIDP